MRELTRKRIKIIERMNKQKKTAEEIGKVLGISRQNVNNYFSRYGITYWNAGQYNNSRVSKKVPIGNVCWKDGVRV